MGAGSSLTTSASLLGRLRDTPDDQAAWGEFVRRYQPRLLEWCRRWGLQEADAQDVCQNVMVRLAAKLRVLVYDPSRSFRGWLRTLARHAWSDFAADRQKRIDLADATGALQSVEARDDLERRLADAFDMELLEEATSRVKQRIEAKTWEAFRITALLGSSAAEAAAELGMPVASVFKAKSNVQKWLGEEIQRLDAPESGL